MWHSTVTTCVATCVMIFTMHRIVKKLLQLYHSYKLASKFRGPPGLPIIGNALLFRGNTEDVIKTMMRLVELYPTPFRIWMGHNLIFGVATPEHLQAIYLSSKSTEKGVLYDFVHPVLGEGLLTVSAVPKWEVHRRLITPTFRVENLQSFIKVFATQATKIANAMKQHLDGSEFLIADYLTQYTLATICETTMGVHLEAEINIHDFAETIEKGAVTVMKRILQPWMYPNFIFNRTQLAKEQQKYVTIMHTFTDNVIQKKKREILERCRQQKADTDKNERVSIPRRTVFLERFLNPSNGTRRLSDKELRDEVNTMIIAGSETVSAVSSYAMLMLASHPEVQEEVYEELCEIYVDYDCEELNITGENLQRMTYLERVIKETMRLFPPGPFLMQRVTDDLHIGEHTFPKGSQIVMGILSVHRDEKYWPDPLKFDPDRFLPEEVAKRHPYAYLPFSAGPRNCIGSKYAMLSLKTFLATILWKYILKKDNITSVIDTRLKLEFVLRPVDPISVRIERRTRKDASI